MRPILKSPRILRTGNPLTLTGIQQVCPAVFAQEPHASRGPRYRYVPTIEPLQALLDTGWGVYEASQQRSRAADRDPYTKHMLRLRKLEHFDHTQVHRDGVPEVIDGVKKAGLEDALFLVGGIIPDEDIPVLKQQGVHMVFTPGASLQEVVEYIRSHAPRRD
jgi:hypothetical protein